MARTLSTALDTHLDARAFVPVDLYELVVGGTTYRFTTFGSALTGVAPAAVATYSVGVLQVEGQRQAAGLVADDLEVTVLHGGSEQLGGKAWVARALDGDLDGAAFKRFEGYVNPATSTLVGCVEVFRGDVAEVEPYSTTLRLVVSVPTKRMDQQFPSLIVQPGCIWDLGSSGCGYTGGIDKTATLATGSTASTLYLSALPAGIPGTEQAAARFVHGAAFAGGHRRAVVGESSGHLLVAPPFPAGVIEGLIGSAGALTLRLGCSKHWWDCNSTAWGYQRIASYLGAPAAPSGRDAA